MLTISNILKFLDPQKPIEIKKLEKSLKLTKKAERNKLEIGIKALTTLGLIENNNEGVLFSNKHSFIRARIRCSSKGYSFAVRDDQYEDIYIREQHLNNAWHGDIVFVQITREGQRRRSPEGVVQCIVSRSNSNLLARLEYNSENENLVAKPLDDRILSKVEIKNSDLVFYNKEEESKNIVEIKIDKYPIAQYPAVGTVVRSLPLDGINDGDLNIILTKNNLQNIINSPRISSKKISEKKREDLTNYPTLLFRAWSNEAPTLPAINAIPHDGGTNIWIHVPTVSERFNLDGKIDEFLRERAEAICLGTKWRPLLNDSLSLASAFKVGRSNEAISLMFHVNKHGAVSNWKFSLSIIKPVCEINSSHLELIATKKITSKSIPSAIRPIKDQLEQIYTIINSAKQINKQEIEDGSIKLDFEMPNLPSLKELQYIYPGRDFFGWEQNIKVEDPLSILNIIIKKSNQILYSHLINYNLPGIIKEYESIEENSFNEIVKAALSLDTNIVLDQDGVLNTNALLKSFEKSPNKRILHKLIRHSVPGINLKTLAPTNKSAESSIDNDPETGIINNIQAPWCCPTLNYWDIFNQSILTLLLSEGKNKPNNRGKANIDLGIRNSWNEITWEIFNDKIKDLLSRYATSSTIDHLNESRRKARSFRNNLISMAQAREAEKIIGDNVDAVITGVQSYGFFAEIVDIGTEGLVHVSTLGDDWYEYRSRQNLLIGRKGKKTYQLAQKVNVKVVKVDLLKNQIDLEIIDTNKNTEKKNLENDSNV